MGGSNGGLWSARWSTSGPTCSPRQAPPVGVMDMLRFDRFTAGRYWVDDYGYPDREADFRTLLAYSPYHNIKGGRAYPAVLVTTADTDDRVVPGHSFKYTAALQAADGDGRQAAPDPHRDPRRPRLAASRPTKIIEEASDVFAFLGQFTGLK